MAEHARSGRGRLGRGRVDDHAMVETQRQRDWLDIKLEWQRRRIAELEFRLAYAGLGGLPEKRPETNRLSEEEENNITFGARTRGRSCRAQKGVRTQLQNLKMEVEMPDFKGTILPTEFFDEGPLFDESDDEITDEFSDGCPLFDEMPEQEIELFLEVKNNSLLWEQLDFPVKYISCIVSEETCNEVESLVFDLFANDISASGIGGLKRREEQEEDDKGDGAGGGVACSTIRVPEDCQGDKGAPVYRLGPGLVNLNYLGNETIIGIQNLIAVIEGKEEPDRYVIVGSHYDAWTFGAVDPNSGTGVFLKITESLAKLQKGGWKPRRTIILCSWDAEEHHLLGSTEWVEDNREMLTSRAVAYLNMDYAVSGPGFHASSTPQLDTLLKVAVKMVQDPDNSSQSLYEQGITADSPLIRRLGGGGSDYEAFIQHVGFPSVDMRFSRDYSVYHSMYDDFVWMQKFVDPLFHRHVAAASILGLVALKLADEEVLPFDYMSYAYELQQLAKALENRVPKNSVNFVPLHESVEKFLKAVSEVDTQIQDLKDKKLVSTTKEGLKLDESEDEKNGIVKVPLILSWVLGGNNSKLEDHQSAVSLTRQATNCKSGLKMIMKMFLEIDWEMFGLEDDHSTVRNGVTKDWKARKKKSRFEDESF